MSESEPKKEEKTVKIQKAAEDMGELVGQGIRKTTIYKPKNTTN